MNIKIIILIVLIIILIILGCWYIINLYNNKFIEGGGKGKQRKTISESTESTESIIYENSNVIIPIKNKTDKNKISMPENLFIEITNFLNAFDTKYNEISKNDDNQNNINNLWILKYKINIYNSELKYYKNYSTKSINKKEIIPYSEILDKYTDNHFLYYPGDKEKPNTSQSLSIFKKDVKMLESYKYVQLDKNIYNNLRTICNIQNINDNEAIKEKIYDIQNINDNKVIKEKISEIIKICKDKNDDTKKTIITVIIKNFINQIQTNNAKENYWNRILIYGFFLSELIKPENIMLDNSNLKEFIMATIKCSSPLFYLLYPPGNNINEYNTIMRYKQKQKQKQEEKDEQYEKRIISTFKLQISFVLNSSNDINHDINDIISYIDTLIYLDRNYSNKIGKKYNLPLEFSYISIMLISKFIKEHDSESYKQINNRLKKYIDYYSKTIRNKDRDKSKLDKLQNLLDQQPSTTEITKKKT